MMTSQILLMTFIFVISPFAKICESSGQNVVVNMLPEDGDIRAKVRDEFRRRAQDSGRGNFWNREILADSTDSPTQRPTRKPYTILNRQKPTVSPTRLESESVSPQHWSTDNACYARYNFC